MRSYLDGMMRYFEFSGRSTRMQYWMFFLVQFVLFIAAVVADYQLGGLDNPARPQTPITLFAVFVHLVPSLTVQVRRLHDIGKSGAWYLLTFVPFGGLVLLYWACCASETGSNYYDGPSPGTYEPRYKSQPQPVVPRHSTIPRNVRMGIARTPSIGTSRADPTAGRFI